MAHVIIRQDRRLPRRPAAYRADPLGRYGQAMPGPIESVAELRRRLRDQRRSVASEQADAAAKAASARLLGLEEIGSAETVALYLANDGELDPAPAVETLRRSGVIVCSPRFVGEQMEFGVVTHESRRGRFGIDEPAGARVPIAAMDVVVAPLVGADQSGNRLGRGAGYYDRYFERPALPGRGEQPLLVGFAYDFQVVAALEPEPHDVPLDALVTPTRVLRFRR
jgi:5-formyltetrahydrofolate cyclo-ligase